MKLRFIESRPEAGDAVTFRFQPPEGFTWKPGQYLKYTLDHENVDERKNYRWFTISAAPHEGIVQITTRLNTERPSSFKNALARLTPGTEIEAEGPKGDFMLDDSPKDLLFIAGGIGITPFRSMLLDLDHRGEKLPVKLLYANRNEDFVFKGELEALAERHAEFEIEYYVEPKVIDEIVLGELNHANPNYKYYISGPEPMVEAFDEKLKAQGIEDVNIKNDFFPGYEWSDGKLK